MYLIERIPFRVISVTKFPGSSTMGTHYPPPELSTQSAIRGPAMPDLQKFRACADRSCVEYHVPFQMSAQNGQ